VRHEYAGLASARAVVADAKWLGGGTKIESSDLGMTRIPLDHGAIYPHSDLALNSRRSHCTTTARQLAFDLAPAAERVPPEVDEPSIELLDEGCIC